MPGSLGHLIARFFDAAFARGLSPVESRLVAGWLSPPEMRLFSAQSPRDQRHAFEAAGCLLSQGFDQAAAVRAALLHDVGKRHSRLGLLGRVFASLLIKWRLPLGAKARSYRDHGPIAAAELEELGSPAVIVAFARSHHGSRPPDFDQELWAALIAADRPQRRWGCRVPEYPDQR